MRILDRHMVVLLGLVALTGLAVALPRVTDDSTTAAPLRMLPPVVDGWVANDDAPEDILPYDSRALQATRWTYSRGDQQVFVAVARYRSRNDPEWRPSINQIAPERGASSVSHERLAMSLNGVPGRTTPVNVVSVNRPDRHLSVLYWYQVGPKTIGDSYRLRLALFLNALRLRGQEVWLVRVAAPASERPEEFLRRFYPQLVKALSR
jgi:EpsI family protein